MKPLPISDKWKAQEFLKEHPNKQKGGEKNLTAVYIGMPYFINSFVRHMVWRTNEFMKYGTRIQEEICKY